MILPKLDYCDFIWNNLAPSDLRKLERLQTRAAKIVLKEQSLSDEQLLQQMGWKTLYSRCMKHRLTFVFRIFKNYHSISGHSQATRRNGIDTIVP